MSTVPEPRGAGVVESDARFRHDLLTPLNHIFGFCSLLIDAARGRGDVDRIAGFRSLFEEGRRVLQAIEEALPRDPSPDHRPDYPRLAERLAIPAGEIERGCERLESTFVDRVDLELAESLDDLARIREASRRLLEMARQGPTDLSAA